MKRAAAEYITKEHGSTANSEAAEPSSGKMSTPAQIAGRKLATAKGRLNRSRPTSTPGARTVTGTGAGTGSNPFGSVGAGQNQAQANQTFQLPGSGFTFGSSTASSFPPAEQSSSAFNFSAPGPSASSSFTFGQTSAGPSNPFGSLNGGMKSDGNSDKKASDPDAMMESSPQKQPAANAFSFGFAPKPSNTGGFMFGQSSQQPSSAPSLFAPEKTNGSGKSVFEQPKSEEKSDNVFGHTSQPAMNGTPAATSFSFGNTSATATPSFSFDNSTPHQPSTSGSSQPSLFKSNDVTSKPNEGNTVSRDSPFKFNETTTQPPTQQSNLFSFSKNQTSAAQPAPSTMPSSAETSKPSGNLFNFSQSKSAESPAKEAQGFSFGTPMSNIFGQKPKESEIENGKQALSGSNVFGQPPKTNSQPSQSKPALSTMFGQSSSQASQQPTPGGSEAVPQNPFAGLFAPQPPSSATGASSPASSQKPLFSFGQTSQSDSPTASSGKPHSTFGKSATEKTSAGNDSSDLGKFTGFSSNFAGSTSLQNNPFHSPKLTPEIGTETGKPGQDNSPAFSTTNGFGGFRPAPNSNVFGPASSAKSSSQTLTGPASSSEESGAMNPFSFSQTPQNTTNTNSSQSASVSKPATTSQSKSPAHSSPEVSAPKRAAATEGPPRVPGRLTGEQFKSYDNNYRLKALNREFRKRVLALDPDRHDFLNIVRNYLDHRESIGEDIGSYSRAKAGAKRKAIDIEDVELNAIQSKRTKETNAQAQPSGSQPSFGSSSNDAGSMSNKSSSAFSPSVPSAFVPTPTLQSQKQMSHDETSELFRSMIPGASNASASAIANSTTPPSSPPKKAAPEAPKFEMPKFSADNNFMAAFAKQSAASAKDFEDKERARRKAEEFDSDEDDEEAWNKKYDEEQRAKKAKIQSAGNTGFVPSFGTSTSAPAKASFSFGTPVSAMPTSSSKQESKGSSQEASDESEEDKDESEEDGDTEDVATEDDLPEDDVEGGQDDDADDETPSESLPPDQSLFSRITKDQSDQLSGSSTKANGNAVSESPIKQPAANPSFKPGLVFGNIGASTPEAPKFSPFTPSPSQTPKPSFVPTTTFSFTPIPSAPSNSVLGSSVFSGGPVRDGPIPGEGLFGSRPSTPSNTDNPRTSVFGNSTSTPSDNTWKAGSAIKFGSPDKQGPAVNITDATPPPKEQTKPFASLFGSSTPKANPPSDPTNSLGFSFGQSTPAPGFLAVAPHLGGTSGLSSGVSSRATSPGATDNESVATDNTEDYSNEPQTSLVGSSAAGEENEDILFECRAQASRHDKPEDVQGTKLEPGWNKAGLGPLRVLKNKETGKTRFVLRADPGANVLLNTNLLSGVKYTSSAMGKSGGVVTLAIPANGKMVPWSLRVKTKEMSDELAKIFEENKSN